MRLSTDLFAYCAENVPKWNTVSISGYHFREKGCTAVQEVAFTLANGMAYVQAALDAGLEVDDFAPRLAFFFNGHNNVFQEVAKFRAARKMWARVHARPLRRREPEVADAPLPHADRRRHADRAAAGQQHRARRAAGLRRGLRRHAVAAHQRLRRGARAAERARRQDRAAHAADHRPRVRRRRHRRPVRRLLLRRGADRRDRGPRARADREDRRDGRLGQRDHVHQERDRGVRLRLPRALPHEAGHRRRRQQVRGGGRRGRGDPARRPRVRARAGRAAEGVQGRAATRSWPTSGSRSCARPPAATRTCSRRSAPRSRTRARSARCAARCATSSASTSPSRERGGAARDRDRPRAGGQGLVRAQPARRELVDDARRRHVGRLRGRGRAAADRRRRARADAGRRAGPLPRRVRPGGLPRALRASAS